jgi:hypothetical protein
LSRVARAVAAKKRVVVMGVAKYMVGWDSVGV